MSEQTQQRTPNALDDPHVAAVMAGLENKSFDRARAVEILESCGYTRDEARATIAKAGAA